MASMNLEEKIKHLEEKIECLEAGREIQNVLGRFEFYYSAGKFKELVDLFAQTTPGATYEVANQGLYEGIESIRQFHLVDHMPHFGSDGEGTGWLSEHNLTTPVIEIARDRKTAKGLWSVPGLHGGVIKRLGKNIAGWNWAHYAVHFVKEEGQWKIWKMHVYPIFATPYEEGWGKVQWPAGLSKDVMKNQASSHTKPTTYFRPYNPENKPEYIPAAPEPYDTYDPDTPLP